MSSSERERLKAPERENRELKRINEIRRVYEENFQVYGARQVWRQLGRKGTRWPGTPSSA